MRFEVYASESTNGFGVLDMQSGKRRVHQCLSSGGQSLDGSRGIYRERGNRGQYRYSNGL